MGIICSEKKSLRAQKFDRLDQLRLFSFDGEIEIILEIATCRLFILLEKNLRWIERARPAPPPADIGQPAIAQRRFLVIVIHRRRFKNPIQPLKQWFDK